MRLSLDQENAQHDSRKSDDFHEVRCYTMSSPTSIIAGGESCGSLV